MTAVRSRVALLVGAIALACVAGFARGARGDEREPVPPAAPAPPVPAPPVPGTPAIDAAAAGRVRDLVTRLCAADLHGRAALDDRRRAAAIVAQALRDAGARPVAGRTDVLVPFHADPHEGVLVAAFVPGRASGASGGSGESGEDAEFVAVAAHHDHLGVVEGATLPGADGSASGVAALVEIARALAAGPPPRRGVLLLSFDLLARSPLGASVLASDAPLPMEACVGAVALGPLGRSFGDREPRTLFVLGEDRAVAFSGVVDAAVRGCDLDLARIGIDQGASFDRAFAPFVERGVPTMLLSSGPHADLDGPGDAPARIDAGALAARAAFAAALVRGVADLPERPAFVERPPPSMREVEALLGLARRERARDPAWNAPGTDRVLAREWLAALEEVAARGRPTVGDRAALRVLTGVVLDPLARRRP